MIKDWIIPAVLAIGISLMIFFAIFVFATAVNKSEEDSKNKTNTICDSIGLDVLSVSKQVFGDDYVICYNKDTNETRRILI